MNNGWNRWIYMFWSPVYDYFFNNGPFLKAREQVFNGIDFKTGEKILFVGVGTGADLQQIPVNDLNVTAIDFSVDMLTQANKKFPAGTTIQFHQMDAQNLTLPDNEFDYVIASLILSVVPASDKAFSEMARVAKPTGTIIIFDKFTSRPTLFKKLLRPIIKVLGTDIGLSFEKIYEKHNNPALELQENTPILFGGMYRKIKIGKN